ncbi:hypothetical protein MOSE0_K09010 [Monosporozyma servazzii]
MTPKSILRVKTTDTISLQNSNKYKNVRFDLYSTTIKRFDSNDEPITISNENSPIMSPILFPIRTNHLRRSGERGFHSSRNCNSLEDDESCWFNDLNILPDLVKLDKKFNNIYKKNKLLKHNNSDHYSAQSELDSFYKENDLSLSDFDLSDNDDDFSNDDDDDATLDNCDHIRSGSRIDFIDGTDSEGNNDLMTHSNERLISDVDIRWKLIGQNVPSTPTSFNLSNDLSIEQYLDGQNIKLFKLEQSNITENKLYGFLIVNNLNFEKLIEIKFSFNDWNNIHYINSTFKRSLTSKFDEFQFVIDLNRYKFFLQIKDLLNKQIKIDLCCRYDVGKETYFDNNNYQNYMLTLTKILNDTEINYNNSKKLPLSDNLSSLPSSSSTSLSPPPTSLASLPSPPSLTSLHNNSYTNYYMNNTNINKNVEGKGSNKTSTATSNNNTHGYKFVNNNKFVVPMTQRVFNRNGDLSLSRTFSEDTDYFNTSPLKHLYHTDTCEYVRKPATVNEVLNIETNPLPLPELLPGPSIAFTKSSVDLFGSLSQQSSPEPVQVEHSLPTTSTDPTSTSTIGTSISNSNSNNNKLKPLTSQRQARRKQHSPPLINSLVKRSLSGSSLSSNDSSASFLSFQSENLTAKRKNDSLVSSISSDSTTIPGLSIELAHLSENKNKLTTTDTDNNSNSNPNDDNFLSNYIIKQKGDLSLKSSSINNKDDLFNMKLPTLDFFNSDLTVSPSQNSNSIENQQDETQSIETDTTFKNTLINNDNNNNNNNNNKSITVHIPRSSSSLENRDVHNLTNNPSKYIPTQNLFQNTTSTDNINDNKKFKFKNKVGNSILQDDLVKHTDYQTLLHSYCFFTTSPPNGESPTKQGQPSSTASPPSALYS